MCQRYVMEILFNPQESLLVMKQEQSSAKKYGKVAWGPYRWQFRGQYRGKLGVHMYCTLDCTVVLSVVLALTPLLCCLAMW